MGLSETRKALSVIISAITSLAAAALIISFVLGFALNSQPFLERLLVTDSLVAECEAQLDSKYAVLEAETGIPSRVFAQVKTNYGVGDSLNRALQNVYTAEDASLYNNSTVEFFNKLCTEYFEGSNIEYDKDDVQRTAVEAARIFSDTVGFHNADSAAKRIEALRSGCSAVELGALMFILLGMLSVVILYTDRKKGIIYNFIGLSGGSLGAAVAAALCIIFKSYNKISIMPEVFAGAAGNAVKICLFLVIPAGLILATASYIGFFITYKKIEKANERSIVV